MPSRENYLTNHYETLNTYFGGIISNIGQFLLNVSEAAGESQQMIMLPVRYRSAATPFKTELPEPAHSATVFTSNDIVCPFPRANRT